MKQSIWLASAKNAEQYKKYKVSPILGDVLYEFRQYASFDGVNKGVILGRMMNAVKQSLRVRGVNSLFQMRRNLINHEKQLTKEICQLQSELISCKSKVKARKSSTIYREAYLEAKIRLKSKILERKNIRSLIKTGANDILKEQK